MTAADEPMLRNLVQLYAYDFAEIMEHGSAGQRPVPRRHRAVEAAVADGCFDGAMRQAFSLRVDGGLAGFAIVELRSRLTGEDGVRDVAEFFVARRHRGRGVGAEAARALFDRFGGRWEVRQTEKNVAALAFWRKVIARYTGGRYQESHQDSARWRGPVQHFDCADAPRSSCE